VLFDATEQIAAIFRQHFDANRIPREQKSRLGGA
jgi:hypothetical protein